ncbi:g5084 [Coccomyxa elongata]
MASLAAVPEAQDCAAQQRAHDDDGTNVRCVERLVSETSPLQAVVWFILGFIVAIPPGALQSAYATDALAFIQQHLDGAGPKDRDSLHALSAGILRTAMAARSGHEGDASAASEVAFDLLAALLQQPVAGVMVLRAAAAELNSIIRQHIQHKSQPDGGGTQEGSGFDGLEGQASLLFLLLEDCFGLLPAWLHKLHADAFTSADLAQVTQDVLAAHKTCTAEWARTFPELVSQTRSMAAALITSLELARDCACDGLE